jgi:O-methyltransferase domain/Dimerisation domain
MSDVAPADRLWDMLRGALVTKALGTAADLGVADALSDRPRPVAELAVEMGVDPDVLHRILRALASDGVFAEVEPGVFANTEASELVRRDGGGWHEFAHLFGGVFLTATGTLDPQTGEATFPREFGTDFWSWLSQRPDERAIFDRAMAGGNEGTAGRLAALDWSPGETVVDVGGGNGSLLRALLERRPDLRGIVFDLPETDRDEASFGDRLDFVAGSFFEWVPTGDVYVLSGILHDWDDEAALSILRTICAAAPDHARLILNESVIPEGNDPAGAKWLDLLMLVLAAGRERNEAQWRALLADGGFRPEQVENGLIRAVACHATRPGHIERPHD